MLTGYPDKEKRPGASRGAEVTGRKTCPWLPALDTIRVPDLRWSGYIGWNTQGLCLNPHGMRISED